MRKETRCTLVKIIKHLNAGIEHADSNELGSILEEYIDNELRDIAKDMNETQKGRSEE